MKAKPYVDLSNADKTLLIAFRSYALHRDPNKVMDILAALVGEKLAKDMLPFCKRALEVYFKNRKCQTEITSSTCSPDINQEESNLLQMIQNCAAGSRLQVRKLSENFLDKNGIRTFPMAIEPVTDALRVSASIEPPLDQSGETPLLYGATEGYDLTNTEALILFSIRSWVFAMAGRENPEIPLSQLFETHKINREPARAFNRFMHTVNDSIIRPMIVRCQCTTVISVDEARLLGTLAACQFHLEFQLYHHTSSFAGKSTVRSIRASADDFLSLLRETERWLPLRKWDIRALERANEIEEKSDIPATHHAPHTIQ